MAGRKKRMTDKQEAFVAAYVKCWNATEAAKSAGYQGNRNTLAQTGFQNLRVPHIRERIDTIVQENAMSAIEALRRLADQARNSMADYVKIDRATGAVTFDAQAAKKKKKMHLVKTLTFSGDKLTRIELYDQQRALELIAKAGGAFDDSIVVNLPPFDAAAWRAQAEERLNEVENMTDPYEELEGEGDPENSE